MPRKETAVAKGPETELSIVRSREALAKALKTGKPLRIKRTLNRMATRLKRGDRGGVINILEYYHRRMRGPFPDYGLQIFGQDIEGNGRRRRMWFLYSPSFGIRKREYIGYSDHLDFGKGPVLSWPPSKLSDKEFTRAAFIGLGTMLFWITKEQKGY